MTKKDMHEKYQRGPKIVFSSCVNFRKILKIGKGPPLPCHSLSLHGCWVLHWLTPPLRLQLVRTAAESSGARSVDCLKLVVQDLVRKSADGMSCKNCAGMHVTNQALGRKADALRTENAKLLSDYDAMLLNRQRDKADMERLEKLVKLHGSPKKKSK